MLPKAMSFAASMLWEATCSFSCLGGDARDVWARAESAKEGEVLESMIEDLFLVTWNGESC